MNEKLIRFSILFLLFLGFVGISFGQTRVTGKVLDEGNSPLFPATVVIEGTTEGVNTDIDGNFTLSTKKEPPFVLVVSFVGMPEQKVEITSSNQEVRVKMTAGTILNEIVVGASRVPENIMQSPVTVEKMDQIAIQQASTADYYDGISKLKGVYTTQSSLTFTSLNTRGFATIANTRFVQLMDGMDNAAPLLNFPTGNIVGIGELDINNVELVPGAASALYGPNAFNGILLMNSKSPFDYEGLSLQIKGGFTHSQAAGKADPLSSYAVRYAKAFNDKVAFKLNASFLTAQDWRANDYETDRNLYEQQSKGAQVDALGNVGQPNFDGMNIYGDETQIVLPFSSPQISGAVAPVLIDACIAAGQDPTACQLLVGLNIDQLGTLDLRRTGFLEKDIIESTNAQSFKADAALHWKVGKNVEMVANYRYGSGASIYQGSERYALRGLSQQFAKLEAQSPDFLARAYLSQTNDGDSYNLTALGATMNEIFSPSQTEWVPNYLGTYAATLLFGPIAQGVPPSELSEADIAAAHAAGRAFADANVPAVGSDEFNTVLESVRSGLFQKGGAGFIDNSRMYHAEGNYNFARLLNDKVNLLVGGNYRMYDLYTEGTIFNEDPDGDNNFERIRIGEYGFYTQVSKTVADDRLKLTGSIRFDKNQNFEGQFSPRVSVVYSAGPEKNHNFRTSYQTGFRNPDTQTQYIWFPTTNILLGSAKDNAERYGIHEGGAWTKASYDAFIANQVINGVVDSTLLEVINLPYIQPEKLTAFELGYKSLIKKKLFIDLNGYYNIYRDFITQLNVVNINPTEHRGEAIPTGTTFRPYTNSPAKISSWGIGLGLNYQLPKKYVVGGSYSWSDFSTDSANEDFDVGFNSPEHRFVVSLSNREVVKNFGFDISYRWQTSFLWENSFGIGTVDPFGSLDAQVNYKIKPINATLKVGATNIIGPDYRTNVGGPFVGRQAFISLTFNDLLNMGSGK